MTDLAESSVHILLSCERQTYGVKAASCDGWNKKTFKHYAL